MQRNPAKDPRLLCQVTKDLQFTISYFKDQQLIAWGKNLACSGFPNCKISVSCTMDSSQKGLSMHASLFSCCLEKITQGAGRNEKANLSAGTLPTKCSWPASYINSLQYPRSHEQALGDSLEARAVLFSNTGYAWLPTYRCQIFLGGGNLHTFESNNSLKQVHKNGWLLISFLRLLTNAVVHTALTSSVSPQVLINQLCTSLTPNHDNFFFYFCWASVCKGSRKFHLPMAQECSWIETHEGPKGRKPSQLLLFSGLIWTSAKSQPA